MNPFLFKPVVAVILIALASGSFAQQTDQSLCSGARGYYRELAGLDARGNKPAADTVRFHADPATKNYILGIPPWYLTYVRAEDFTLPEPPANSSPQTLAEIKYLKQLEKNRSPLDVQVCMFMAGLTFNPRATEKDPDFKNYQLNLFQIGKSIGTWYNPEQLPETARLLARVYQDASFFIWTFKYRYSRIRPYTIDPALHNLEDTDWPAYPSGHAGQSYVTALVLSALAPEYRDVFMKDAYDIAHSREVIGVHFPSDSEASRILACQLVEKLFTDKRFKQDFRIVQEEWKKNAREVH